MSDEGERIASLETEIKGLDRTIEQGFERIEKTLEKSDIHFREMHKTHFEMAQKQGEKLIVLTEHCNNAMLAANGSRIESEKVNDALQAHKDGHSKWNRVIGWGSLGLTGAGGSLAALKDVIKELLK